MSLEFGGRLDKWLLPLDDDPECPDCESGVIEGDRWEWWCSANCGYHGDNFPD